MSGFINIPGQSTYNTVGDLPTNAQAGALATLINGSIYTFNGTIWVAQGGGGGGSGTVTTVSVVSANGLAGTVSNPTTTPAITLSTTVTGILKGNGTGISAAVAGDFPTLNQNTTGSAATFTGSLSGDVTGTQSATTVATVGGSSAANVHNAELAANAATSANTASTIIKRDSSGNASVSDPVSSTQIATKNYVDNAIANGGVAKAAVIYATTAALPSNIYSNGASGVGATLTGVALAALSIDGNTVTIGQRVLIKNEATAANNGVYVVTTVGSGIAAYVLTRASDFNQSSEISQGDSVFVTSGATLASTTWVMTSATPLTVGTNAINWAQTSGPGSITIGAFNNTSTANALDLTGTVLSAHAASGTNPGDVSTGTQTFAGSKTIGANASDATTIGAASSTAIMTLNGGQNKTVRTITGNLTVDTTTTDYYILCNNTSSITITLPAPTVGRTIEVMDINGNSSTNIITLAQHSSEQIQGVAASFPLSKNYGAWIIVSDGTNWWVQNATSNFLFAFGGGSDGNVTISSGTTTLTRDMYYNNLTISSTGILKPAGFKIFVMGILDLTAAGAGAIQNDGGAGGAGNGSTGAGGTAGAVSLGVTLGVGTVGIIGGVSTTTTGTEGGAGSATVAGEGGGNGIGSAGGTGSGGAGGIARPAVVPTLGAPFTRFATDLLRGLLFLNAGVGGGGGSGGGGNATTTGGGGGGGGAGGGILYIAANLVKTNGSAASAIQVVGGVGGAGGTAANATAGGGSGGSGGGGGWIYFIYGTKLDAAASNILDASGGAGGTGGNGTNGASSGGGGSGGGAGGRIDLFNMTTGVGTETFGGASTAGNAQSGGTGGAGAAGQSTKVSF